MTCNDYSGRVLATSPLAYFKGTEVNGAAMFDSSENCFHGSWLGGINLNNTPGAGPTMGNAPAFNGSSGYGVANHPDLLANISPTLGTLMIWAKLLNAAAWTDGVTHAFLYADVSVNESFGLKKPNGGSHVFGFYQTGLSTFKNSLSPTTSLAWNCYIMTYDQPNEGVTLYVNGAVQPSTLLPTPIAHAFAGLYVGQDGTSTRWHKGWAHHAAIWNVKLPPATISTLSTAA